jgi:hypothetical protein
MTIVNCRGVNSGRVLRLERSTLVLQVMTGERLEFAANSKRPLVALRDVRRELERPVRSGIQTTPPCRTEPRVPPPDP